VVEEGEDSAVGDNIVGRSFEKRSNGESERRGKGNIKAKMSDE